MLVETKARVGVFAIALGAYLPQFPTLVPEFEQQYADFKKTIPDTVEIVDGGIVTTKELSMAAGDKFRAADVDLVILQLLTYATSYNMLPAVRDLDVPVVLVNVQKKKAPADRHHRLRKRHGAAGTKRHSADFCHLGCKRCVLPLWRENRSCSRCSLQGGRHQRCRRHLLWGSAVQAVQGGFEHPDGGQIGKHSGFCQQSGQHHHQPPRCHPRHAHPDRSGGLTHGAGIFRTICPP